MGTVIMPKMGDAMEEGTLLKWLKAAGDEIAEGDPIAEIETDKVTLEIEAQESGFLTNVLLEEGTTVPIGAVIATIGPEDEIGQGVPAAAPKEEPAAQPEAVEPAKESETQKAQAESTSQPAEAPSDAPDRKETPTGVAERSPGSRLRASPLVKRLAGEHGIDLSQVAGTGPGGRIVKNDIADFVSGVKPAPKAAAPSANGQVTTSPPAAASGAGQGTLVELSRIRRTTGKRMTESKLGIPHYYVTALVDMTAALDFRNRVNASLDESGDKVSVNDLIVKAAALGLRDHPEVNTSFENGELFQHGSIDINVAIALNGGLIAPFVPGADTMSLRSISQLTRDLGKRAREGGLNPEEYQGGTFTISNLGMFDVDEFIAVINPPQAAILAVGSVTGMPVVKDGEIVIGQMMKLTLSADHRALDGAQVATFLQSVRSYLENPLMLAIS